MEQFSSRLSGMRSPPGPAELPARPEVERYRAGPVELNADTRRVFCDGQELHLAKLSFDVLLALLRRAPGVVSKEQLMLDAWPGLVVAPGTVRKRITLLREALADTSREPPIVRVVRGRGYAIGPPVDPLQGERTQAPAPGKARGRRLALAMTALLGIALSGLIHLTLERPATPTEPGTPVKIRAPLSMNEPPDLSAPVEPGNVDPVAYEAFLKGRILRRSLGNEAEAIEALERAIDIAPRFAAAHAELSITLLHIGSTENREAAAAAASRALALDDRLPLAIVASAAVAIVVDWDWDRAEALIRRGRAVAPGDTYLLAYEALLTRIHGDMERSVALSKIRAADQASDAGTLYALGQQYYRLGRYREAIEAYRQALILQPGQHYAHLAIGRIRALQGQPAAALEEARLENDRDFRFYSLAIAHTAGGNDLAAREALAQFENVCADYCPYWIADVYAYRGDVDAAFLWLEAAFQRRDFGLLEIKTDPLLANIRGDPRYSDLITRMGLD
jgi:DNA-binding winged helix-turn-helix (wHTH) protein/tetratricopeptide (TPR) repeat protein